VIIPAIRISYDLVAVALWRDFGAGTKAINLSKLCSHRIAVTIRILRKDAVLGRSYSDPQEGLSEFSFLLLLANSEISIRAATVETPTVTTMNSKMISIFWFCLRF
jgi:hypothetical protein